MRFSVRNQDPVAAGELARACGVAPAIAQVLLHRGIASAELARGFLDPRLAELTDPSCMADRDVAADRLAHAVRAKERIVVFGDYDVDGTTSTAILAGVLEELGGDVVAMVASRFAGGYGFSEPALERVLEARPTLLVTCDCGSSDHERIAKARARGVDVVVVDHHLVPQEPLPALAFLNPHRPECAFPYKGLASAGLAFSLAAAVRARLDAKLDLRAYLDLVALGTIADLAPLDGDNRRLVRAGLARISSDAARPGVAALRDAAKSRANDPLSAVDVAFRFAPRLNAAGRLGDPSVTLALLRARDTFSARTYMSQIEALNEDRKRIEAAVTEAALAQARAVYGDKPEAGVVVAQRGWHRGVIGISAARLVETFDVPVVVVAIEDDGVGHGSARTPDGGRLYDALHACRSTLVTMGGHQSAAGLVVREENLDALRASFSDATRGVQVPVPTSKSADVLIGPSGFGVPRAQDLLRLEPVGEAFADPMYVLENAEVMRAQTVGDGHLRADLRVGGRMLSAFGYRMADRLPKETSRATLLGQLRSDTWRGADAVELRIVDID